MRKENKKIITVSFLVAGFLVALVVNILAQSASAASGMVARALSNEAVSHGIPVVFGLLSFLYLQFNSKTLVWADEVVSEIRKVVWPSRQDTTRMTIVVCILLVMSGIVIGSMDAISAYVIKLLNSLVQGL